jgi:peptidyl-prolyl cis-trans isomerase SurA
LTGSFVALFAICNLVAQDPILFSVEENDIPVSEFEYIYKKNNRDEADYSRASIEEYLDLYIKFKLKVQAAKDIKLDTITALKNELAGYRRQLANSYLNDKEVTQKLVLEAWNRQKEDVHISHILIKLNANATSRDTLVAFDKIQDLYLQLLSGTPFDSLAMKYSEDKNTSEKGGDLGFITALLPNGFYNFETAAYSLQPGDIAPPVRTSIGYHIIKMNARRPARGEIEAAHILVRVNKDGINEKAAKSKIDGIYNQLVRGADFQSLARRLSEDEASSRRGGSIGSFGINVYDSDFEEAAFALEKDGDFSKPVRTRIGWHIVKRLNKKFKGDFEKEKKKLEARIAKDERINFARQSMIQRIKEESGFKEYAKALDHLILACDPSFYSYQWKVPTVKSETLIAFNDGNSYSNIDFAKNLKANTRGRMKPSKSTPVNDVIRDLYQEYVNEKCLAFEEGRLESKYPDFKALMREYEEGILLFEVTKMSVWDRATKDTSGLKAFHEANTQKYMWGERAMITSYTLQSSDEKMIKKVRKLAKKFGPEKAAYKVNKKEVVLSYQQSKVTQQDDDVQGFDWQPGYQSATKKNDEGQSILEKFWVIDLKEKYKVNINNDVLESLIKN